MAWKHDEVDRVLVAARKDELHAALWLTMLLNSLRVGEVIALRWEDLSLDERTISIRQTRTRTEQGKESIGETFPCAPAASCNKGY